MRGLSIGCMVTVTMVHHFSRGQSPPAHLDHILDLALLAPLPTQHDLLHDLYHSNDRELLFRPSIDLVLSTAKPS